MSALRRFALFSLVASASATALAAPSAAAAPNSAPAQTASARPSAAFDGVVEALRQSVIAAQVTGAVVKLDVKAGDRVRAGQVLLRIDARAADQTAAAGAAQARAALALQEVAAKDHQRQQQLFAQHFISQAALDRATAEYRAAQAQVAAQLAQAGAARTQTGLHVVLAPYAGVVAQVPVALGDMALPGRPLVEMYDPSALRVTAWVPQSVAAQWAVETLPRVELPGLAQTARWPAPTRAEKLPTLDAATHTVQVRVGLPAGLQGVAPGLFARLWLPVAAGREPSLWVPTAAIVRRAELTALYVQSAEGKPLLRQVRLGRSDGERIEVLTGVMAGERVLTDPQAAARSR
ncbi:MAG: efflux RND transporter periplasmic adaptor subunit [Burkholderiaceae bacterium]|nr:efflux RND transporter periplasmic adaptor subunit [Burkholderiaceae bacterium]